MRSFGGYLAHRKMQQNREQMVKAAFNLKPVISYPNGLPLYFLTGEKYLYQTLFCITSLVSHSKERFNFILIDDGSFNNLLVQKINKLLPGATVHLNTDTETNLKKILPINRFKNLWNKRSVYPHIRKLTDIHTLPGPKWKLVLDSDMLFWDEPKMLINWLKNPVGATHMIDCEESYGYTPFLMQELAGATIPKLLNVGVLGIKSAIIDWNKIEHWIGQLEEKEGKTYFLEQALSAMIVANENCTVLDAAEYVVNPNETHWQVANCLHHYVSTSKKEYFNLAWKKFI